MTDLFDQLFSSVPDSPSGHFYGVVTGIVTNINDPEHRGRVRLKLPWLSPTEETGWARLALPMAADQAGFFFLPDVNTEVVVAFEAGDITRPYVLGSLWNGKRKPPLDPGKNNEVQAIVSRSGHMIRLTDTPGKELVEITDPDGKAQIVLDMSKKTITISADSDLTLESRKGKVIVRGKLGVQISTDATLTLEAKATAELKGQAKTTIKGGMVEIN